MLPPVYKTLTRFRVYESTHKIYIIGGTPDASEYRILKIDRFPTDPEILPIEEDDAVYDQDELDSALEMLGYSLESTGGLTLLASGVAILGCIKFLYGYYLHLVTASHIVARIGAHAVHAIDDTTLIQLWSPQAFTDIATNVVTPDHLQSHTIDTSSPASPLTPAPVSPQTNATASNNPTTHNDSIPATYVTIAAPDSSDDDPPSDSSPSPSTHRGSHSSSSDDALIEALPSPTLATPPDSSPIADTDASTLTPDATATANNSTHPDSTHPDSSLPDSATKTKAVLAVLSPPAAPVYESIGMEIGRAHV